MEFIVKILLSALGVMGAAYLLKGVEVKGFTNALIAAVLLAVANAFVKPILTVLTLPITLLTAGLFLLVINGLVVWLVSMVFSGFKVQNFTSAILFSVVLWLVNMVLFAVFM